MIYIGHDLHRAVYDAHICIYPYIYIYIHVHIYIYVCMYVCVCMYIYIYSIYIYIYTHIHTHTPIHISYLSCARSCGRASRSYFIYTRSPSQDFRLFGPRPWKILATIYDKSRFMSNPDPGENLVSGNLVMETGCMQSYSIYHISSYSPILYSHI